ncbi:hypothetical protein THAOC_20463 [Thalassiosira oceanica]|uniref:Uncharacterized protein n=1 Tax=Thalassiosira oceanica TaxID=159749 RepID=K0SEG3_THAOC|nr:hypothetical protein THAOC_20463 [Thalassiosira oceanica]|eukprot:EJK59331.1 hypothetical protein THAOC_20463 [Thalassiosira oceanica]
MGRPTKVASTPNPSLARSQTAAIAFRFHAAHVQFRMTFHREFEWEEADGAEVDLRPLPSVSADSAARSTSAAFADSPLLCEESSDDSLPSLVSSRAVVAECSPPVAGRVGSIPRRGDLGGCRRAALCSARPEPPASPCSPGPRSLCVSSQSVDRAATAATAAACCQRGRAGAPSCLAHSPRWPPFSGPWVGSLVLGRCALAACRSEAAALVPPGASRKRESGESAATGRDQAPGRRTARRALEGEEGKNKKGEPHVNNAPLWSRKRARKTEDCGGGVAQLNVESPGTRPFLECRYDADILAESEQSEPSQVQGENDDVPVAQPNDGALSVPACHGKLQWMVQRERALERRKTDEINHRQLVSLRALQEENALLKARLEASEERSQSLQKHKLEVDDMRLKLKELQGCYSDALKWAYTAETTPREHWIEKGYPEDYADQMANLQQSMRNIIKDLRMGTVGSKCTIDVRFDEENLIGISADHDDVLMPYWKELANAIIHWSDYHSNKNHLEIYIAYIETPNEVLDVLRPAIKQSKVKFAGFVHDGTPKSWKLAEFVEDIIQTNHNLTQVGFTGIILSSEEWKKIFNAIRIRNAVQSSIIRYLGLSFCFDGGINTEVLKDIFASTSAAWDGKAAKGMRVQLLGNGMSSREVSIIAESLSSLAYLNLDENRFGDADAAALAEALSSSTTLRRFSVKGNNEIKIERKACISACNFRCLQPGLVRRIESHMPNRWARERHISPELSTGGILEQMGEDICDARII